MHRLKLKYEGTSYFNLGMHNPIGFREGAVVLGVNRKDNRQVSFRVSDSEFERLSEIAESFQMSVPAYVKKRAQGARMRPPKIDREGAFEIAHQLRGIGNNVNQLARHANEGKTVPPKELESIQKELNEIWQQFNSAIQK